MSHKPTKKEAPKKVNNFGSDGVDMRKIRILMMAKAYSDARRYGPKHSLLNQLMQESPNEFYVDSDFSGKFPGLTHSPSGFRIHAPRSIALRAGGEMPHEADRLDDTAEDRDVWETGKRASVKMANRAITRKLVNIITSGDKKFPDAAIVRKGMPWNDNGMLGELDLQGYLPDAWHVLKSTIKPELRGMGLGVKMYGKAIDDAARKYSQGGGHRWFDSGHTTSEQAKRVWDSLIKRKYPITVNPDTKNHIYRLDLDQVARSRGYMGKQASQQQQPPQTFQEFIDSIYKPRTTGQDLTDFARAGLGFYGVNKGMQYAAPRLLGSVMPEGKKPGLINSIRFRSKDIPGYVKENPKAFGKGVLGLLAASLLGYDFQNTMQRITHRGFLNQ